jgi:hypothetical protein
MQAILNRPRAIDTETFYSASSSTQDFINTK